MVVIFYGRRIWRQEEKRMLTALKVLISTVRPSEVKPVALSHDGKYYHFEPTNDDIYPADYWVFPDGSRLFIPITYYVELDEYQSHIDVAQIFEFAA